MRRTLGMALVLAVVALLVGTIVAVATFPSEKELQRISFEELGLDPGLLELPFVQQLVDETSGRVQDRVLAEARSSALKGAAVALGVTLVGTALIVSDRRRNPAVPATNHP